MLGLRAKVRGSAPVTMALPQESYMVRASATWSRRRPGAPAQLRFAGGGMDDRGDHLWWFQVRDPALGAWMQIEVVETNWINRNPFRLQAARDLRNAGNTRRDRNDGRPGSARRVTYEAEGIRAGRDDGGPF